MAQQTINVGAAPNDGTGTPLRTAFQYTNSNFSELYTATGPSGNNITVPGTATISGDLTVDTNTLKVDSANNRVGIGTATPATPLNIGTGVSRHFLANGQTTGSSYGEIITTGADVIYGAVDAAAGLFTNAIANASFFGSGNATSLQLVTNSTSRYEISSTGVATWSNVGGSSGTAMTLNATGLGVGTTPSYKLHVFGASPALTIQDSSSAAGGVGGTMNFISYTSGTSGANIEAQIKGVKSSASSAGELLFFTSDSSGISQQRFMVDGTGNLGIGVTPSAFSGVKALQIGTGALYSVSSGSQAGLLSNAFYDGAWKYISTSFAARYDQPNGSHQWFTAPSGTAGTAITFTPAMTLDESGNLFVRCTTAGAEQLGFQVIGYTNGNYVRINHNASATSGDSYLNFLYNATPIGSISQNGTTGVLYNINSDYRLKESVQPLVGGLARVNALKPSVYKWKSDGSTGEGFLAHELAEVVPFAVTGEKDAVNEDGSIKSQGIDMSRVVPILVAAIQELTARVQTLETR